MSIPRLLSALDLLKDRTKYDLDAKPERWVAGAPFQTLDIRPGRVLLIGAPPGAGKTTAALQITTDLLARHPLRAVVMNVETCAAVLLDKVLARLASVEFSALLDRMLTGDERRRIDAAVEEHGDVFARLRFAEGPHTVPHLFAEMRDFDARLAVVDYVQRLSADGKEDRAKLDHVMNQVRRLADQGAAVIVISSVARQKDRRGSSTYAGLSMAAFRGSAELEFGADSAFLLHSDPRSGVARLENVKERFGQLRDVPLRFCGAFQRFDAGDDLDGYDAAPEPQGTVAP